MKKDYLSSKSAPKANKEVPTWLMKRRSYHTGIVERVENGIVYTVEGNSGDSCRQCQRAVGNYEILGYGVLIP